MEYPDTITCPRCGREDTKINHDNEERMVTHLVPVGFMKETSGRPAVNRPRCRASSRRPENALIPGSIRGREDLRLKR